MGFKPPKISHLLYRGDSSLKQLTESAKQQQRLLAKVRSALPPDLAQHCLGAALGDEGLTVFTDTPAWVTPLRYCAADIQTALQGTRGFRPGRINVRILPPSKAPAPHRESTPVSQDSADLIAQTGDCMSDTALGDALKRLAEATRNKQS